MKMDTVSTDPTKRPTELETRAAEALAALLRRISSVKLLEMKFESWPRGPYSGGRVRPIRTSPIQAHRILAYIDVFGHRHTLACEVYPDGEPNRLRAALRECQASAAPVHSDATPILIAPYLSPEAQELCKQSKAGFIDFEGNARLTVGEVFIVMRSLPGPATAKASAAVRKTHAHSAPVPIVPGVLPDPTTLPVPSPPPNFSQKHVAPVGGVASPGLTGLNGWPTADLST